MKRADREQARRLGVYVDQLVTTRRRAEEPSDTLSPDDRELEELSRLADHLYAARILEPPGLREALAKQLQEIPAGSSPTTGATHRAPFLSQQVLRFWPRIAVSCAVVLFGVLWLSPTLMDVPVASAQSVLHRSNEALTSLAGPGEVLYRRWRVRSNGDPGMMAGSAQPGRIIEEWMDGANPDRVAARWFTLDGQLQVAYTTVPGPDGLRPHVYFSPGVYGEPRGLLNIEPTRAELEAALSDFPRAVASMLRVYLDRHYIYAPILGEREYNHAVFSPSSDSVPEMPRVLVSYTPVRLDGRPVYRVRLFDAAAVTFNWRSTGPSLVRVGQAEIVRYIARDSFLSLRTEQRVLYDDGRQRDSIRELAATEVLSVDELRDDPFHFTVPDGTPVRRQSAHEHLASVADALMHRSQPTIDATR